MKNIYRPISIAILIAASFVLSALGQSSQRVVRPPFAEDTRINPHDFTDDHLAANGIIGKKIISRRTGTDFLSVFGMSSDWTHTNIRVTVTLPAYGPMGEVRYWYPLGELNDEGFTVDEMGKNAQALAAYYRIYVFPQKLNHAQFSFTNNRQAALIDDSWNAMLGYKGNPLGLRTIVTVEYSEKAFGKAGFELMEFMAKKNGFSLDGTPIIKTINDLDVMLKNELLVLKPLQFTDPGTFGGAYAINPTIDDPTGGVIAADAFLLTVLNDDGKPLNAERAFFEEFNCLQKTRNWCSKR